jgi:hypothetical protein
MRCNGAVAGLLLHWADHQRRSLMRTRILAACLLPLLLVTAAACTKSKDGKGVASVGGSAAPSVTPSLSRLDQMIRYTRCVREHGVPMADPEVNGSDVKLGKADKGAAGDKLYAAEDACKQYRPAQEVGPVVDLKHELARKFSKCMREHGVENYPDPRPDGQTRTSQEIGDDPQYLDAREICTAQQAAEFASRAPSPRATP